MSFEHGLTWVSMQGAAPVLALTCLVLLLMHLRLRFRHRQSLVENTTLRERAQWMQTELDVSQDAAAYSQRELTDARVQQARLETLLEARELAAASEAERAAEQRREFAALSERALQEQTGQHSERLSALLAPLATQLGEFRNRIDQLHRHSTSERVTLQAEVNNLRSASERIGQQTQSLAQALRGDQSLKGDWGEVVLESLLKHAGLRPGIEFLSQPSCRASNGQLRRPDVIVRLPDERDVVIDAKVSLGDYRLAAEGGERKHLKRHATRLWQHVTALAEREYERLEEVRSLELVLMFVPLDAALSTALEANPELLHEALNKRVAIVSPSSLMLVLRLIQSLWQQQSQQDNAHLIAQQAAGIHDQFGRLLVDLDEIYRHLSRAERAASGLRGRLDQGPDSMLKKLDQLQQLGVPIRRQLGKRTPSG